MSEPIPESIPTSADPRSRRPIKRARGPNTNTAIASQANEIETLFLDPSRPVNLPAASTASKHSLAPPPEIVANVQGSSAGAGSGEFHVYKASRRREYERLRVMDEEAKKEEEDEKWAREEREKKERDEERTRKNRERRNKKKGNKEKGKDLRTTNGGNSSGGGADGGDADIQADDAVKMKKKPGGLQVPRRGSRDDDVDSGVAAAIQQSGITIHDDD